MIFKLKILSNNGAKPIIPETSSDQTQTYTPIPVHSYPLIVLIFWGIVSALFVINLLICTCQAPHHLRALRKITAINRFSENKEYFKALSLHRELCCAYPQSYTKSYALNIAVTCFECSKRDLSLSLFKEGLSYLKGERLDKERLLTLHRALPEQLRELFQSLFDVLCREKNKEKEYLFVLNDDRVKLL